MPRINMLNTETVGVDLRTNPLFLGNKRLHAATNLVFEEGVIRTRPGIIYQDLKAAGMFQGCGEYRPAQGISSQSFGEEGFSLFIVVDGVVYKNCKALTGDVHFKCNGEVNLYQAENYFIFQNPETDTFWWDGEALTRSPGLNEVGWNDPETPRMEAEVIRPTQEEVVCGDLDQVTITFRIIDHETDLPLDAVTWTIQRNGNDAFEGVTDGTGTFSFVSDYDTHEYFLEKAGYQGIADVTIDTTQTRTYVVRMKQPEPLVPFNIHGFLTNANGGSYNLSAFFGTPLIAAGNAAITKWRLRTDACGFDIVSYAGDLDDNGSLIPLGENLRLGDIAFFDPVTQDFVDGYLYPEGMYLQLGVVIDDVLTWPEASPCIAGGNGTP